MSLPDPGLFHFLRPAWLLLILPALLLWWQVRRADRPGDPRYDGIAPHLARALTVGLERRERLLPIDGVLAIACLLALGAAGPTWSRAENPFLAQTAPLVVVLEVSESMEASDIAPTRLERAKQKIADLLALRSGGRTALVAYAGSAHRVAPLTRDAAVLKPFLDGLDPKVMPRPGENATAALTLARSIIAGEPTPGAILWLADGIAPADRAAFAGRDAAAGALLLALPMTAEPGGGASFSDAGLSVVSLTPDTADIRRIDRRIARAWQRAQAEDGSEAWEDRGPLLAWPAALLCLLWFRRGWTMRWDGRSHGMAAWLAVPAALAALGTPAPARADGLAAWFFTPDQRGRLAFEDKRFADAAALFADPAWRGYALYRAGSYEEAAALLAEIETPEAALTMGLALVKSRQYRPAIAAFETALERDPDNAAAARNLEIARAILAYVETAREQSDTGEQAGIGADDVVYDNEEARGTETQDRGEGDAAPQSAEQWMRSVDTRTADFLRSRFALENAAGARAAAEGQGTE